MNPTLLSLLMRDSLKVADLETMFARAQKDPAFVNDTIWAMRQLDPDLAWRAVWLLKRYTVEAALTDDQLLRLAASAGDMTHWAARLNLCQLFAATGFPESAGELLHPYLSDCFANRRPMIRAWALSALAHLGDHPDHRARVVAMLRKARNDPAGSVQARLRRMERETGTKRRGRKPGARQRGI